MKMRYYFVIVPIITLLLMINCTSMYYNKDYQKAREKNTIESYKQFIAKHPEGVRTEEVMELVKIMEEKNAFLVAKTENSINAYKEFIQAYPNSEFVSEAEKRLAESDTEAFIRTCCIGTKEAFQGFVDSHPNSKYNLLAVDRIDFLEATVDGTLASYRLFIDKHSDNLFVYEAIASFPVLWLKEYSKVIGTFVEIGDFTKWKGIFGGGKVSKEEIREKVFSEFSDSLGNYGVQSVLIDSLELPKNDSINALIVLKYQEKKKTSESPYIYRSPSSPGLIGYFSTTAHDYAVSAGGEALGNIFGLIFHKSVKSAYSISSIENLNTGLICYTDIPDLSVKVSDIEMVRILDSFGHLAEPSLLVALNDRDENVRKEAILLYSKLTGKEYFGEDSQRYHDWWQEYWNFELERHDYDSLGFSIELPRLWNSKEWENKMGAVGIKAKNQLKGENDDFYENMVLSIYEQPGDFTIEEVLKSYLGGSLSKYELYDFGNVIINDIDSRWVIFGSKKGDLSYLYLDYHLLKDRRSCRINFVSKADEFYRWRPMFENIALSFRFEDVEKKIE